MQLLQDCAADSKHFTPAAVAAEATVTDVAYNCASAAPAKGYIQ